MNLVERVHGKEMHIYMLVQKHSAAQQIVLTHGRKCKTESLKQLIIHWVPQFHYANESLQVFQKVTKNGFQHSENDWHLRVTISSLERCAIA